MKLFDRFSKKNIKVNFVIAGTQKGGTSALTEYLRLHPEICMAERKEVHFFDTEEHFLKKPPDYTPYHVHFRPGPSAQLFGEATPAYMYWSSAPGRIWEYNPDMKIIMILRNPIERAYSHWNMQRDRGKDSMSFYDALKREHRRCREALPFQHKLYSYIGRGFYTEQIRRIWQYFPDTQTLIMKTEDMRDHPEPTLRKIYEFLGVHPPKEIEPIDVHSRSYVTPLAEKEERYLENIFEFEIRQLERMLGWDCSKWLS